MNAAGRDVPFERGATALLLVDMQTVWVEPGLDPHLRHLTADSYYYRNLREHVIPNQIRLANAARAARAEVLHTIIQSLTRDGRDRSLDHKLSDMHVSCDDPNGRVIAQLGPVEDEIVLPKTSSGVFNSTAIDYVLRNLGVRHLLVAGALTDQCVDMAVRDGADRGYYVTCVGDACGTHDETRHEGALRAFGGYCRVMTTDDAIAQLAAMAP